MYRPECQPVTQKTIDEAVDWLWTLDRTKPVGQVSCCEAVLKAIDDPQVSDVSCISLSSKLHETRKPHPCEELLTLSTAGHPSIVLYVFIFTT